MLNIPIIEAAMRKMGLTGTALAAQCGVSKEATSNWLKGESLPRPSKLARLAAALELSVDSLLLLKEPPKPVFAYRTKRNKPVTGALLEAADEQAMHLAQLVPYVDELDFEPPVLKAPILDNDYIRKTATHTRESVGLKHKDVLSNENLELILHTFGAILVPVLWGMNKQKHENALTIYQAESKNYWVVFNINCYADDYKYWLAHELGHCLTMHVLDEEAGETFAEKFAQNLIFPDEIAHDCLEQLRASNDKMTTVIQYAEKYGISVITVLKAVDRLSSQIYGEKTNLDSPDFYAKWSNSQKKRQTITELVVGSGQISLTTYIAKTEQRYKTPIFKAISTFQEVEGGRNPAFISKALNISLGDAISLSCELWTTQP